MAAKSDGGRRRGRRVLLRAPLPRLNGLPLHGRWSRLLVQFKIQAAGVANWLLVLVSSPKRGQGGLAIDASHARSLGRLLVLSAWHLGQRSVCAVVLMVEAAGIAQVVSGFVASPKRGRGCTTVDALFRRA